MRFSVMALFSMLSFFAISNVAVASRGIQNKNLFGSVEFEKDKEFIAVGFDVWREDSFKAEIKTSQDLILSSINVLEKYKQGDLSFGDFPHSEQGMKTLLFVLAETLQVLNAAAEKTESIYSMVDLLERENIGIRWAIMLAH